VVRLTLEDKVRAELLAVRKTAHGLTVATMSVSPVICGLMGNGDPAVAYNAIKHQTLDADSDTSLMAAMSSLGLSSDRNTHLARLEDFGFEHGYDQRQVRRYSDKGIRQLARLIATNWATISVPQLDVTVVQTAGDSFGFFVQTRQQYYIEMRQLKAAVRRGDEEPEQLDLIYAQADDGLWIKRDYLEGIHLAVEAETSLTLVWAGELWPKYAVQIVGDYRRYLLVSESLGSKLMLRIRGLGT
jgi:hypothetical protein